MLDIQKMQQTRLRKLILILIIGISSEYLRGELTQPKNKGKMILPHILQFSVLSD